MRERQSGGGASRRLVSGPNICTGQCQVSLIPRPVGHVPLSACLGMRPRKVKTIHAITEYGRPWLQTMATLPVMNTHILI